MPMDRTAFYADDSTPASIASITAAMADAEADEDAVLASKLPYEWANSSERAAQTGMSVGSKGTQADTGVTYRYDGSAWKEWESDWITWTTAPTNLVVGTNGSASSLQRYKWVCGRLYFDYKFVLGSSGSSVSTPGPTLTLPVSILTGPTGGAIGPDAGYIYDVSAAAAVGFPRATALSATSVRLVSWTGATPATTTITSTNPMTWAAGDIIAGGFWADPA